MYFPQSQIKTDLYTNGGEFVLLSTNQNYQGPYWSTSSGKYYTKKNPQDIPYEELIKLTSSPLTDNSVVSILSVENENQVNNQNYNYEKNFNNNASLNFYCL